MSYLSRFATNYIFELQLVQYNIICYKLQKGDEQFMLKEKQNGYTLFSTTIAIIVMVIFFSGGIFLGNYMVDSFKTDNIILQCNAIDRALVLYSDAHNAVLKTSVILDDENRILYKHTRIYPNTLEELGVIRYEQGYFSREIDFDQFHYSVNKKEDGSMTYTLSVVMPNGAVYVSPCSTLEL